MPHLPRNHVQGLHGPICSFLYPQEDPIAKHPHLPLGSCPPFPLQGVMEWLVECVVKGQLLPSFFKLLLQGFHRFKAHHDIMQSLYLQTEKFSMPAQVSVSSVVQRVCARGGKEKGVISCTLLLVPPGLPAAGRNKGKIGPLQIPAPYITAHCQV